MNGENVKEQTMTTEKRPVWKRPRTLAVSAAILLAAGGAAAVGSGLVPTVHAAAEQTQKYEGATDTVQKGTLSGETSLSANLKYADPHGLTSQHDGVLTGLPAAGDVLGLGARLYTVGNQSAFLMRGAMPAWRDLSIDTTNGVDVLQLEQSLKELGFFSDEPDQHFNWTPHKAVVSWQKSVGLPQDGIFPLGRVLFEKGDLRVGQSSARLGDQVSSGSEIYKATSTSQVVSANVALADQGLAVVGAKATLHMPDGTSTTGTISSVGTPIDKAGSGSDSAPTRVIPIEIAPDDPAAVSKWQEASITIGLPSQSKEDVLSVPVGALLALDSQTFGLEIVGSDGTVKRVPVTPGLFAAGRVEVSGDGVHEGDRVAVPGQ